MPYFEWSKCSDDADRNVGRTCSVDGRFSVAQDVEVHREGDRNLEPEIPDDEADEYAEWDFEPTHEKWVRGRRWS